EQKSIFSFHLVCLICIQCLSRTVFDFQARGKEGNRKPEPENVLSPSPSSNKFRISHFESRNSFPFSLLPSLFEIDSNNFCQAFPSKNFQSRSFSHPNSILLALFGQTS